MPPEIPKETIAFDNHRIATVVFPPADATAKDIISALGIKGYKALLLIIGGADSVSDSLKTKLAQLFSRGIASAAATVKAVIIDGGTKAGVMEMMGQGVADRGDKSSLVGVAPLGLVNYPGSTGAGETPLDPNHSHFVLVEGNAWGSETSTIYKLAVELRSKVPALALIAGGGSVSKNEALRAVRHNISLIVVEGSGGLADEIAAAWKARPVLSEDPALAEIIEDGRIELHLLSNSVKGAERLIVRQLGGDNALMQAWERFADYDLNAVLQQKRFQRLQLAIIVVGVLGTALALINQVWNGNNTWVSWRYWWFYWPRSENLAAQNPPWVGWWLIHYLLIIIPILVTILITGVNRFKQGNKWLLLRSGAEAIKREIYRYRTRAGDYREVLIGPPVPPPTPGAPPQPPPPTPEQVLAQRVETITRRVMGTEVNSSSLVPYDKGKGFPPYMYAAQGGDDGFSVLTPDRYVQVRLGDQLSYYRKKAVKHERKLKVIQWSIFIIGGLGTLLAAINQQVWIALTTAVATALATYLSYQQTENTLMKYNQAANDLDNVRSWWTALPADDQANPENVKALVEHTETVLQSELDGWVQQMQNALAELRKGQAQAAEREESGAGGGPENMVTKYNQAVAELANIKLWWTSLPDEEKAKPENKEALAQRTERVQTELAGGVQKVESALAELRQEQTQTPEEEEPAAGGGADESQTDEEEVKTSEDESADESSTEEGDDAGGEGTGEVGEEQTEGDDTSADKAGDAGVDESGVENTGSDNPDTETDNGDGKKDPGGNPGE